MILAAAIFFVVGILCFAIGAFRWKSDYFQLGLVFWACGAAVVIFGPLLKILLA